MPAYTVHGAVTLVLTTDEPGGCLFTSTADTDVTVIDCHLQLFVRLNSGFLRSVS
jgi:hypothetical protein